MKKKSFEEVYTNFQCAMIAQFNKYSILGGIGSTQFYIMDLLNTHKKPFATSELAKMLHVTPPAISRQIKKLLERGYIIQERSGEDRRYTEHSITQKGLKFLKNADTCRSTMMETIKNTLNKEELDSFTSLCDKIINSIEE